MIYKEKLNGKLVMLRTVELSDCNENYLRWMNDEETNRYMETRWITQTPETILEFVSATQKSDHSILFAIIENVSGRHIGNIKIGPINKLYQYADISYFIGEKDCLNEGLATEAVQLICEYGFETLQLHRVQAGCIEGNNASIRVLEKAGFRVEGRQKDKFILNGKRADHILLGFVWGQCEV